MRPLIETLLAAFLVGLSLFVLLFGLDGLLIFSYHVFPLGTRTWLFDTFPPRQYSLDMAVQIVLAVVVLLVGAFFAVGVHSAYPSWRKGMYAAVLFCLGYVVWAFVHTPLP